MKHYRYCEHNKMHTNNKYNNIVIEYRNEYNMDRNKSEGCLF